MHCSGTKAQKANAPLKRSKKITLLLSEDQVLVRQGVRSLLEHEPDFQIVGETGGGLQTVELAQRVKPDVLLLDLMLPSLNGLEVTRQVRKKSPQTQIIILTLQAEPIYLFEAFRKGALGYVLKDSSFDELVKAIREVQAGRRYVSTSLSRLTLGDYLRTAHGNSLDKYESLTARQREVLQLVTEGKSSPEIGQLLGLSCRTVETHRAAIMKTLGIHRQTELVRYALTRLQLLSGSAK